MLVLVDQVLVPDSPRFVLSVVTLRIPAMTKPSTRTSKLKRMERRLKAQGQHDHPPGVDVEGCCVLHIVSAIHTAPCSLCGDEPVFLRAGFRVRVPGCVDDIVPVEYTCPCGCEPVTLACEIVA